MNHDNYLKIIEKHQVSVGDELIIDIGNITYQGILIPTSEYNYNQNIVIKLKNGYNVGIDINKIKSIKKTGVISKLQFSKSKNFQFSVEEVERRAREIEAEQAKHNTEVGSTKEY